MSRKTVRNLIIAVLVFVIVVGAVALFSWRVLSNSQTLENQIAAVAEQNQQEESLLRLQKLAQASDVERAELASYFLLKEEESISFLREIESMAPSVGIALQTDTLKKVNEDSRDWIEFSFNAEGNRVDVQNFVQILEIIPYVSRIMSVNLESTTDGRWSASITIQVQVLTYDQ